MKSTLKNICQIALFHVLIFSTAVSDTSNLQSATLKKVTVGGKYSFNYMIQIIFCEFQDSSALSISNYKIFNIDRPMNIIAPEILSAAEFIDNGNFKRVNLFTTFNPIYSYRVEYKDAITNKIDVIDVVNDSSVIDSTLSITSIMKWISANTFIDMDIRQLVKTNNAIAADFNLDLNIANINFLNTQTSTSRISFISIGKLGTDSIKTPNTIKGEFLYSWLDHTLLGKNENLFYGFRLPIGFEGTQDFRKDSLFYTIKLQAACSVPYISDMFLWWHKVIGYNENFLPPVVFLGYTYAFNNDRKKMSRIDAEIIFNAPVGPDMSLNFSANAFYFNKSIKKNFGISTNITTSKITKLVIKYVSGKSAPLFNQFENWGLGFNISI